jgi:UDP-glucose 4-epimerase
MKVENKQVLVTGGAGFIGSHIVDELVNRKCEVTVIDDFSHGKMKNLNEVENRVHVINGSVTDANLLRDRMNVDIIYHESSLNLVMSTANPYRDSYVNVYGMLNILEEMKRVKSGALLVFASTGSVYGEPIYDPQDENHPCNPVSPYGISKLSAEHYLKFYAKDYGIKYVILRYYNVVGSRQNYDDEGGVVPIFVRRMLEGKPLLVTGDGKQTRCFTDVSDVVRANILAYESECKNATMNIASDEIMTINQLARMVQLISPKDVQIKHVEPRVGDIGAFHPSIEVAYKTMGYKPKVKLKESLSKIVEWVKCELDL